MVKTQARRGQCWSTAGAKKQHEGGTGGRVNEPPGMDGRKSERLVVLMSPGNRTSRDPEEGRGRRGMEPLEGKMERASNLVSIQTSLHRIAELASISTSRCATASRRAANPCARRAGCGNSARPDLWGARADRPGLPDTNVLMFLLRGRRQPAFLQPQGWKSNFSTLPSR